jgi:hypothetical protein
MTERYIIEQAHKMWDLFRPEEFYEALERFEADVRYDAKMDLIIAEEERRRESGEEDQERSSVETSNPASAIQGILEDFEELVEALGK